MRGVVTLAAAASLPLDTPQRPVLVLAAFTVVAGTLLVQGATLPSVVRRLHLPGPDAAEDALAAAAALQAAVAAGSARLDELAPDLPPEVVERAREKSIDRANWAWERLGGSTVTPSEAYQRARLEMLGAERRELANQRDSGRLDEEVLREVQALLDIEESMLVRARADLQSTDRTRATGPVTPACEHLRRAWPEREVAEDAVCACCIAEGTTWVHLRVCLDCGNVACCDSSPRRHAQAHFAETSHPVMRSAEPGESWRWCYVDERLG
jgi:CPA1 family monovalent cation:H+ antiporter